MTKVKSYVKQVLAQLTGDQDKVVAEKNYRKASAAVKGQVAALEGKLVDLSMKVEEKEEILNSTKYPTTPIGDAGTYCSRVKNAQDNLDSANEELEAAKESKAYFESLLDEFEKEEEG